MNDPDLPCSLAWNALHAAAWAHGWSLGASSAGYRAGWRYEATRGTQRRQWETADAVAQWIAGGCMASLTPYYDEGGITIYHGDCREVLPLLTERPRLVLADPPYGVNENTKRASSGRGMRPDIPRRAYDYEPVAGDDEPFDPAPLLALKAPAILWGANHYADKLPPSPSWLVWDKKEGSTPDDNADCEMAWSNLGGPARMYHHLWRGFLKASERDQIRAHPTQKPVALMRWCLKRAGLKAGDLVYDPYMGSGPVARACKDMGLRYIGIELVERYCAIAAARLAQSVMHFEEAA